MNERKTTKNNDHAAGTLYEVIHILSDINRMQILRLLADNGELCARDILSNFPITQPTLSHHMNILLENHLVEARKSGRWVFYHLSQDGIQQIIDFFETLKNSSLIPSAKIPQKLSPGPMQRIPDRTSLQKAKSKAVGSASAAAALKQEKTAAETIIPSEKPENYIAVQTGFADKYSAPAASKKEKKKDKDKDKDKDKISKKEKKKKKNKKK